MANVISVKVPDIGDFKNVGIIEVLVKPGDKVDKEQSLITLESDKASIEIPAPEAGVIKELKVKVGDKVSEGDLILMLEAAAAVAKTQKAAPAAQGSPAAPAVKPVKVPDIGDFKNVGIIEVLVTPGDKVSKEQSLITLESDKASIEIPAPEAGVIKELKVKVGDKVSEGDVILMLETSGAGAPESKPAPTAAAKPAPQPQRPAPAASRPAPAASPATLPPINEGSFGKAHASPSIRKFARELGADLGRIQGTGPKSRILREDILNYVKRILSGAASVGGGMPGVSPPPKVDFASFGPVETQPLSNINKLTGKYLHSSWFHIPHVTQFDEADITELESLRKKMSAEHQDKGVKITLVAFLVKAAVAALKEFPRFNASLDPSGENLVLKKYFHIGVAVDTPDGLTVPVIRDSDKKGIAELAAEIADVATRARQKKIRPNELQGGCFTISSLGGVGGTAFTPIVNQPEVAILGVSRSSIKPVYDGKQFQPKLMLPLSLSYDHRVIDGVLAAKFTTFLSQLLADIKRLSL
ncbi:MAG TPA: dihydrolipoyllysine-residue acetyltransferase [Gammaproteobacteria bacterium]|nr:dihydrolipoyllysine-residue acetyltransferase [Gammaproteobacteria bacterium]